MRISEVMSHKAKTPEQLRLDGLKQRKDKAADALKRERAAQKHKKAISNIASAQSTMASLNK